MIRRQQIRHYRIDNANLFFAAAEFGPNPDFQVTIPSLSSAYHQVICIGVVAQYSSDHVQHDDACQRC